MRAGRRRVGLMRQAERLVSDLQRHAPLERVARAAKRELRGLSRRFSPPATRVVYHVGYQPPESDVSDARRAQKIIDYLLQEGRLSRREIVVPDALDLELLLRVHHRDYLERLDEPTELAAVFGLERMPVGDAIRVVEAERWATAGTVRATGLVLAKTCRRAVNLGGGYHHARAKRGKGFCVFNDVAVAIADARARGFDGKVLVIDLDLHHGDGTRSIFADDETVFTCSLHADHWDDDGAVASLDVALGRAVGDATYLEALGDLLREAFARGAPDLCFYVAGVDIASDDRLGSWRLTPDAIFRRDQMVFEAIGDRPAVMVLAGGYGTDAWRYTARTVGWLLGSQGEPIASHAERDLEHFRRVATTLGIAALSQDSGEDPSYGITSSDVLGELVEKRPSERLLGFYTPYGIELALQRYGLMAQLKKRGYDQVKMYLDTASGSGESVTVVTNDERGRGEVLIELVVKEARDVTPFRLISIEWLLMQDPRKTPTPARPLLPGQAHPGLGGVELMMGMLVMACERLHKDGLGLVPAHYHVAAQSKNLFRFLEPEDEARFLAYSAALRALPLAEAARLSAQGCVVSASTGERIPWKPARMVLAVSPELRARVESKEYDERVEQAARQLEFVVRAPEPAVPSLRPPALNRRLIAEQP